jgi:hypothetical protein
MDIDEEAIAMASNCRLVPKNLTYQVGTLNNDTGTQHTDDTSEDIVNKFAAHSTTALKNQNRKNTDSLNSLQLKAIDMMKNATSITPALQDMYQGECRESTFDGMPELVTGNRKIADAIEEGLTIYHAN